MGKGGAQEESRLIKHYADQWCKDNGYPVQQRKYVLIKKGTATNDLSRGSTLKFKDEIMNTCK
ncbi:MAG TPA: hypothetical protein DCS66_22470 [Flavobacteriaceae bacterium]|nr:hypothetical protein [Flavobacteriaceae bacterium]|tara:strand:+ start:626 stop:814 length:189 start_codon:yes stop_codon:yes gene_type:complete